MRLLRQAHSRVGRTIHVLEIYIYIYKKKKKLENKILISVAAHGYHSWGKTMTLKDVYASIWSSLIFKIFDCKDTQLSDVIKKLVCTKDL